MNLKSVHRPQVEPSGPPRTLPSAAVIVIQDHVVPAKTDAPVLSDASMVATPYDCFISKSPVRLEAVDASQDQPGPLIFGQMRHAVNATRAGRHVQTTKQRSVLDNHSGEKSIVISSDESDDPDEDGITDESDDSVTILKTQKVPFSTRSAHNVANDNPWQNHGNRPQNEQEIATGSRNRYTIVQTSPRKPRSLKNSPKKQSEERLVIQDVQLSSSDIEEVNPLAWQRPAATKAALQLQNVPRRQCRRCIEWNVVCDGGEPCDRCFEFVDGESKGCTSIIDNLPVNEVAHSTHDIDTANNELDNYVNKASLQADDEQLDLGANEVKVGSPKLSLADQQKLGHIYAGEWLPKSLNDVTELLKQYHRNMKNNRGYVLQAKLDQAKQQSMNISPVASQHLNPNPWKNLLAQKDNGDDKSDGNTKFKIKSNKRYNKSFVTTTIPTKVLATDLEVAVLPKYKSIGRLGSIFLAKNAHTLTSIPYFPEDEGTQEQEALQQDRERRDDMDAKYRKGNFKLVDDVLAISDAICKQRECLEIVHGWTVKFTDCLESLRLTPGILQMWLQKNSPGACPTCNLAYSQTTAQIPDFPLTTDRSKACQWLHEAFPTIAKVAVWHFVGRDLGDVPAKNMNIAAQQQAWSDQKRIQCPICYLTGCQVHGSYSDGKSERKKTALVNDPEHENNKRTRLISDTDGHNRDHICGIYCLPTNMWGGKGLGSQGFDTTELFGLDSHGNLNGRYNDTLSLITDLKPFSDKTPCGEKCFLFRSARPEFDANAAKQVLKQNPKLDSNLKSMAKVYGNCLRLPCKLARMRKIDCTSVFHLLLALHFDDSQSCYDRRNEKQPPQATLVTHNSNLKDCKKGGPYDTSLSTYLAKRAPFVPCSHDGPCLATNKDCTCAQSKVHCEWICRCDGSCRRRFPGCKCKGRCWGADCPCFAHSRECDPHICKPCSITEVLNPANRYRYEKREGLCKNNKVQLDLPARVIKSTSEVQGWGLFAGQDLKKEQFIGEYKGELVSIPEANRRGVTYHKIGIEYLFKINTEQEMDGTSFGNKTRFINHSKAKGDINVKTEYIWAEYQVRLKLVASRPVKAGDELMYDYGYEEQLTKFFFTKGQKQAKRAGVVAPIMRPQVTVTSARTATPYRKRSDKVKESTNVTSLLISTLKSKRKRISEDDGSDEHETDDAQQLQAEMLAQSPSRKTTSDSDQESGVDEQESDDEPEPDALQEDDAYVEEDATESHSDRSEAEISDSERETVIGPSRVQPVKVRTRTVNANDKRFGGEAQRKAAHTRAMRQAALQQAHSKRFYR